MLLLNLIYISFSFYLHEPPLDPPPFVPMRGHGGHMQKHLHHWFLPTVRAYCENLRKRERSWRSSASHTHAIWEDTAGIMWMMITLYLTIRNIVVLTITDECICKVECSDKARERVIRGTGFNLSLYRCQLHLLQSFGLQLGVDLVQLQKHCWNSLSSRHHPFNNSELCNAKRCWNNGMHDA